MQHGYADRRMQRFWAGWPSAPSHLNLWVFGRRGPRHAGLRGHWWANHQWHPSSPVSGGDTTHNLRREEALVPRPGEYFGARGPSPSPSKTGAGVFSQRHGGASLGHATRKQRSDGALDARPPAPAATVRFAHHRSGPALLRGVDYRRFAVFAFRSAFSGFGGFVRPRSRRAEASALWTCVIRVDHAQRGVAHLGGQLVLGIQLRQSP